MKFRKDLDRVDELGWEEAQEGRRDAHELSITLTEVARAVELIEEERAAAQ